MIFISKWHNKRKRAMFKNNSKYTLLTFLALSGIVCLALREMEC